MSQKNNLTLHFALSGNRNSLGAIRLVLAISVVFSHAFYLGGWGADPLVEVFLGQDSIGGVAVIGFFAISGYLITRSGMNSDGLQFIWRRFLRIFPAYWVVLLFTAFLVGPTVWYFMGKENLEYWQSPVNGPVSYLISNWDLTQRQWGINEIYGETPWGAVFNGSLWTLAYEWAAYLVVFGFVLFGVLKRAKFLVPLLTAFFFLMEVAQRIAPGSPAQLHSYFSDHYRVRFTLVFLIGACLAVYAEKVIVDAKLGLLSAAVVVLTLMSGGWSLFGYPAMAYFLMWMAVILPNVFQKVGEKNDYSYGTYIYGFLTQQTTAFLGWHNYGYLPWTLICVAITLGLAWLSWHLVERRALVLKDYGPGRGVSYWSNTIRQRIKKQYP
jgi:peptidoglycan/LPS O-acetylase OafA/YrhL